MPLRYLRSGGGVNYAVRLGTSILPVRFRVPPSVTLLNVVFESHP